MASRSYLARLAQPLTAADPVVWSVPRVASEESRQAITVAAPKPIPGAAVPRTPAMSRQPDARIAHPASPRERSLSPQTRDQTIPTPPTAPPIAARTELFEDAATLQPQPISEGQSRTAPDHRRVDVPEVWVSPGAVSPFAATSDEPAPIVTRPESLVSPGASTPRWAVADRDGPRLHIGTIEVRLAQPAAPAAPAPVASAAPSPVARHAATPIARGYASRFGLAQG